MDAQNTRWYHGGSAAVDLLFHAADSEEQRAKRKDEVARHHPLTRPAHDRLTVKDGKLCVRIPPAFVKTVEYLTPDGRKMTQATGETLREYVEGSICFGLVGHGFYVVPPGGYVEIHGVPEQTIKDAAPHLLTFAEALARGICDDMGRVKVPETKNPKPSKDIK